MRIRWSRRAALDLIGIGDFIAADHPAAARAWVERLRARAAAAARSPFAGRQVPELAREDIREVLVKNYRIVYRVLARRSSCSPCSRGTGCSRAELYRPTIEPSSGADDARRRRPVFERLDPRRML